MGRHCRSLCSDASSWTSTFDQLGLPICRQWFKLARLNIIRHQYLGTGVNLAEAVKKIIAQIINHDHSTDHALCDRLVKACFDSEDYIEGRRAFYGKA